MRLLVLLFDAYANRQAGVSVSRLAFTTGTAEKALSETLENLKARGLERQARDEAWRYKPA